MAGVERPLRVCLLVVIQINLQAAAKSLQLPPFIKTCSKNDPNLNQCAIEHGREALPLVINGFPAFKVPPLDPLMIAEVRVDQGGDGSVGISLVNKDLRITVFKDIILERCNIDLKNRRMESWFSLSRLEMISKYEINGRVLVLPIKGNGDCNVTLVGAKMMLWLTYGLVDKDGEEYLDIKEFDLLLDPSRAYFKLTNLFNGDKALGDNMNLFLNENWSDVMKEIGPDILVAVKKVWRLMIDAILNNFSFDTIFPD